MFFSSNARSGRDILAALDSAQAVIEFTPDGRILAANANFLNTMAFALGDIQGRHHAMFCDAGYAASEAYIAFWRDLAGGQSKAGVVKRLAKGGKVVWLEASYTPIRDRDGKVVKVVKLATDVTAVKLTEIDQRGKVDAINRSQAVIEFTSEGEVLTANDTFLRVLGYRLSEIQGKPHALFCDRDDVASANYRRFWEDLKAGRFQSGEFRRIGKGGAEVYIQAIYSPIFDDTGTVVKVVKFAIDITDAVRRRLRNEGLSHSINADLGGVVSQVMTANSMASSATTASAETGAIINSVAAASEELSQSVHNIAHSMQTARSSAESVVKRAETANAQAATLDKSAASMTNIVTLIQDIAGQINLLALNATIESARAGEAGKGFAVVASEVKNLANQAAASTKTISAEIATMQSVTGEVVQALGLISASMTEMMQSVTSVATAIEQQTAVTGEISHNMQSAVSAIDQINEGLARISQTFSTVVEASDKVKANVESLVA